MTFRTLVAAAAVALLAGVARAQDAVPCKALTCVMTIDWGGSKTSGDYGPDKRYGSGDDFEQKVKAALAAFPGATLEVRKREGVELPTDTGEEPPEVPDIDPEPENSSDGA